MDFEQRLLERSEVLTPTERRLAESLLAAPHLVAFGTVAEFAADARAGTATVVRFATKLGYDGYSDLQASVQRDLTGRLRPAVERIRDQLPTDVDGLVDRHADIEAANVRSTLESLNGDVARQIVARLADEHHDVLILSGVASRGVAMQFLGDLSQLRSGCAMLDGTPVDVARTLALTPDGATIVALDLRRYERWVLDALTHARRHGSWVVAVTDSVLSPLAAAADTALVVEAASTGPFDSHVGTLALLNLLVVDVSVARREAATERLDRLESTWRDAGALTDD